MVEVSYSICYSNHKKSTHSKGGCSRIGLYALTGSAYPVCRQDRHLYFFLLFLLSKKVRNATIKLPKEIRRLIIPINIKIISAAVILRTSLPMYSGEPVIKLGRLPPLSWVLSVAWILPYFCIIFNTIRYEIASL